MHIMSLEHDSASIHERHESGPVVADSLRSYLNGISQISLLTSEEEVALAKRIEVAEEPRYRLEHADTWYHGMDADLAVTTDADAAKKQFASANLRLVVPLARKRQGRGIELLDLIQEGNTGVMHAVEKFDWRKGFKFSTYATWWINQRIENAIIQKSKGIRVPRDEQAQWGKLGFAEKPNPDGTDPSDEKVADDMGISLEHLHELRSTRRRFRSLAALDAPAGSESDSRSLGESIHDRDQPGTEELALASAQFGVARRLMLDLTDRERAVIDMRFGLRDGIPRTLDDIADFFNLSRERIGQIERRALHRMREGDVGAMHDHADY
jgi:RNA polymerase sigma factor (sigma-70 family)